MALSRRLDSRAHRKAPRQGPTVDQAARPDHTDVPSRLGWFLATLDAAPTRAVVLDAILAVTAMTGGPERVAGALIDFSFEWLGGQGWGVVIVDEARGLVWLTDRGIATSRRPALTSLATKALDRGEWAWLDEAAMAGPVPTRGHFAALAVPLSAQGRPAMVLVGVDKALEGQAPLELPSEELAPVTALLEAMASAIDVAMRLRRAETLSSIDDLTGLFNSRYLSATLRREVKRASRTGRPLSLLFVDLDGFKGINDRYGHLCGSRALVEASARIQSGARETDIVARFGGDEFAIVLPETDTDGAFAVAQRVRVRIAEHPFLAGEGIGYRLTASVGVATLPDAAGTPEELLSAADAAMYRVKARGKNGIETAGALRAAASQSPDTPV